MPSSALLAADLDWVVTVGWHDPACHAVGQEHTHKIRELLKSSTSKMESYINFVDPGVGECAFMLM